MELQFDTAAYPCLRDVVRSQISTEQTQEIKLPDGMPDIGRTLGVWGQPILRSKQWNSDHVQITGGVMAWALYAPEDGSAPRCMETWIPFQLRWEMPRSDREGILHIKPEIQSVDARTLSARKMMVRVTVGADGHGMLAEDLHIPQIPDGQDGVAVLKSAYPVTLPREAGEKNFLIDEDLNIGGEMEKIISCTASAEVAEEKIVGDKIAFRGSLHAHLLYEKPDGSMAAADQELPFSQYTELDRDYGKDSFAVIQCCTTSLETEIHEDDTVHFKCGMVGQYEIFEEKRLELPEDAYSLDRELKIRTDMLQIPALLEHTEETVISEQAMPSPAARIVDASFYPHLPQIRMMGDTAQVQLGGDYGVLYYDEGNNLQYTCIPWQQELNMAVGDAVKLSAEMEDPGQLQISGGSVPTMKCSLKLQTFAVSGQDYPVIVGMEIGEKREKDPLRPSVVLQRAGQGGLWELAKRCGSTVADICAVNGITDEVHGDRMLIIPVK